MVLLKFFVITILVQSCFGTELFLNPNNISNYKDIETIKAMENIYLSDIINRENEDPDLKYVEYLLFTYETRYQQPLR